MLIRKSKGMIAVVSDGQKMFAETFSMMLERLELFKIVHTFTNKPDLWQFFLERQNDAVCLFYDCSASDVNSIQFLSDIKRVYRKLLVLILCNNNSPFFLKRLLEIKPNGIISKNSGIADVVHFLNTKEDTNTFLSSDLAETKKRGLELNELPDFTTRELEILQFISKGKNIAHTANSLNISPHTVIAHRRNMMQKSKCHSVTELLVVAKEMGLLVAASIYFL